MFESPIGVNTQLLRDGCEFALNGTTYSNVIDDLLALVQNVIAGIASVSSNIVNGNCLEFRIHVSANQPIVILRYELYIPKYSDRPNKRQHNRRTGKALSREKICEASELSNESNDKYILPDLNENHEVFERNSRYSRGIHDFCSSVSQSHPQFGLNHLSSRYVYNQVTHLSKKMFENMSVSSKLNFDDAKSTENFKKNWETSSSFVPFCDKEMQDIELIKDNAEHNNVGYLDYSYSGYRESSASQRDEREDVQIKPNYQNSLILNETYSDEEAYQEYIPVKCILDEDENNNPSKNFDDHQNDFDETSSNELVTKPEEIVVDNERTGKLFQNKQCDLMFKKLKQNKKYEKDKSSKRIHTCQYCDKIFPTMAGKLHHENAHVDIQHDLNKNPSKSVNSSQERIHSGEKLYSCSFCGKCFDRNGDKDRHEMIHTGEKPYSCSVCGRAFNQLSSRNRHEKLHSGEKPHACRYCGKCFARLGSKNRHEKTRHAKIFL